MTQSRRQETIQPVTAADPQIGRWLWMLEDTRALTNKILNDLDDPTVIDWKPNWALHSIGTLLYHIALVEADWLYIEVLGNPDDQPYPAPIDALFPYPIRSNNALTPVMGIGLNEHRQRLTAVRRELMAVFSTMRLDEFRRVRHLPESDVTPEWVLHHLAQHEAEHRSEIAALRTAFTARTGA
jgi:uncharacterized damage-inducible protein DinB